MNNLKSLNDIPKNNTPDINTEIFYPETLNFINTEGFIYRQNDSYCSYNIIENEKIDYISSCYFKYAGSCYNGWHIHVYIFNIGIGVDIDYECGGNSSTYYWLFKEYNNNFELVYNKMVDFVNDYKNR